MATPQNTRDPRGNETLLSKRVFTGNTRPRFHSNFARWSNDSATEPRLALDVTWEGPHAPQNAFEGYGVLVALSKERLDGDLVLLIRPEMEDLALALADGESFVDACSKEQIASSAKVLGRVIAERQYLSDKQLFDKAKAFKLAEFASVGKIRRDRERDQMIVDRIDAGIVRAQNELSEAVAAIGKRSSYLSRGSSTVFWEMSYALPESLAYKQLRDTFREDDAEVHADPQIDYGEGLIGDRDVDGPLKDLISIVFRAGQYAGPEQHMLDPEPDDCEAVEQLITESLARVRPENDGDSAAPKTEPACLASFEIGSVLTDLPTFHAERDRFRLADTEEARWAPGKDPDDGNDFPLRSMLARWFRAGMLAARTFQKSMPAELPGSTDDVSAEAEEAEPASKDPVQAGNHL